MRGGRRPGAGRKQGSKDRATAVLAADIKERLGIEGKPAPLDVILQAMYLTLDTEGCVAAVPYAREAAPYMHAKLAAIEGSVDQTVHIEVLRFTDVDDENPE